MPSASIYPHLIHPRSHNSRSHYHPHFPSPVASRHHTPSQSPSPLPPHLKRSHTYVHLPKSSITRYLSSHHDNFVSSSSDDDAALLHQPRRVSRKSHHSRRLSHHQSQHIPHALKQQQPYKIIPQIFNRQDKIERGRPDRLRRTKSRPDLESRYGRMSFQREGWLFGRGSEDEEEEQVFVGGVWKLGKRLGSGAFANVYEGIHGGNGKESVAVKVEKSGKRMLKSEYKMYEWMWREGGESEGGVRYVPKIFWCGRVEGVGECMVMEKMGMSLGDMMESRKGRGLSSGKVLEVGMWGVRCLQWVHGKGVLHRDIKPDNMVMGKEGGVCLVDFGLGGWYRVNRVGKHLGWKGGVGGVGTVDFASVRAMKGERLSRRDDLVSLGYCLVYLWKGSLPWERIEGRDRVLEMKTRLGLGELCRGMPKEMLAYFKEVTKLRYGSRPDYAKLEKLFKEGLKRKGGKKKGLSAWGKSSSSADAVLGRR